MKKIVFQTSYTDAEFRQVLRDEFLEAIKIDRNQDNTLLNVEKALEYLRDQHGRDLKASYIYQLVHRKELKPQPRNEDKKGEKLLFSKADLSAWAQKK